MEIPSKGVSCPNAILIFVVINYQLYVWEYSYRMQGTTLCQINAQSYNTLLLSCSCLHLATMETRENFDLSFSHLLEKTSFFMSAIKVYFSCRNLVRTPTKLLVRSGP